MHVLRQLTAEHSVAELLYYNDDDDAKENVDDNAKNKYKYTAKSECMSYQVTGAVDGRALRGHVVVCVQRRVCIRIRLLYWCLFAVCFVSELRYVTNIAVSL
jgi:hypothetical protein